jgi:hypothetical protein
MPELAALDAADSSTPLTMYKYIELNVKNLFNTEKSVLQLARFRFSMVLRLK